jgi:hypothetical protein
MTYSLFLLDVVEYIIENFADPALHKSKLENALKRYKLNISIIRIDSNLAC